MLKKSFSVSKMMMEIIGLKDRNFHTQKQFSAAAADLQR